MEGALLMPEIPTQTQERERLVVEAITAGPHPRPAIRDDAFESRARLFYRAISLALASLALALVAASMYAVTGAFVDRARAAIASPVPVPSQHLPAADQRSVTATALPAAAAAQDWPHALVAVISVLLVGEVVLAIGLIRATFSLRIHSDAEPPASADSSPTGPPLPGVELLKAITEAFGTVLKGLPKR